MIKLRNSKQNYEILAPTSLKELNFDDILELVKNVNVSEHYALVMIAQSLSPMNLALAASKPDADVVTSVSTFFIKSNDPNNKVNGKLGDKVITSRSDLERSIHLSVPCGISLSNIAASVADDPATRTMLRQNAVDENGDYVKEIVTIAFKLLPLTGIYAIVDKTIRPVDKFRATIKEE